MLKRSLSPSRGRRRRRRSSSSSSSGRSSHEPARKKLSYKDVRVQRDKLLSEKFGYSDESNPFGDATLSQPFIWKKKVQLLEVAGRKNAGGANQPEHFLHQTERKIDEIDRVRRRRQQREEEERLLEEQQAELSREREQEHYGEWQAREEAFHREATRQRTNIRLKQGRERPSDLLAKSLRLADDEQFEDPSLLNYSADVYMERISIEALKDLLIDAEQHHDVCRSAAETPEDEFIEQKISWARGLERGDNDGDDYNDDVYTKGPSREALIRHQKFWNAILLIGTDTLEKRLKQEQQPSSSSVGVIATTKSSLTGRDVTTGIALQVLEDLNRILEGKTEDELNLMEKQVQKKLKSIREDPSSLEDPTYWETIQEKLPYSRAVAELRRVHQLATEAVAASRPSSLVPSSVTQSALLTPEPEAESSLQQASINDLESPYWPPLVPIGVFRQSAGALLDAQEFFEARESLRRKLIEHRREKFRLEMEEKAAREAKEKGLSCNVAGDTGLGVYEKFVREEESSMGVDEFVMTPAYEMPVRGKTSPSASSSSSSAAAGVFGAAHQWDERFRPRKPRFFNRVKTGYEWTKYNQSHFDRDNPPPKAVQGYKFNLFYPDLIDKTKAPKWKILPSDTPDTVLIRFTSGPPYEEVMFKIVNREWDMNTRKGFRNTFDRGILQLHFNFKRYRYRK